MASPSRAHARRIRVLACEACRARRTRCDGRKPVCGTCETRSCECSYPQVRGTNQTLLPTSLIMAAL